MPHVIRPVEVFIPSRDRALQLDATLRSFAQHCSDRASAQISVLFRATTAKHRRGYKLLAREHPGVRLLEERSFSRDAARILGARPPELWKRVRPRWGSVGNGGRAQLLVVDDTIFIDTFSLESMINALLEEPEALGFSLRLGETIRFCQPLGIESSPPELSHVTGSGKSEIVSFRWHGLHPDWGYPLELSSSLYRRDELTELVRKVNFDSPTTLEHELWLRSACLDHRRPRLLCYRRPRAVSLALNRVQSSAPNPISAHRRHETGILLERFLEGWRIDVSAYDGFVPHACHEETELILVRSAGT